MTQQFQKGEIVQLKSGGPRMTIRTVFHDGSVSCQWFAGTKLQEGVFHPESLKTPEEDKAQGEKRQ